MVAVPGFVRRVARDQFLKLLEQLDIQLPALPEPVERLPKKPREDGEQQRLLRAVDLILSPDRDRLEATVKRLGDMTDELGQAALLALPGWRDHLRKLESAHERVLQLYLASPEALQRAEDIRYAEEHQNALMLWDAFEGPQLVVPNPSPESDAEFRERLAEILEVPTPTVDRFDRTRSREGTIDLSVVQFTIYSEGPPNDDLQMVRNRPVHVPRRPVIETTVVYEPASGIIEVTGKVRKRREEIAVAFAETKLGGKIDGSRLPRRRFNLLPLLKPCNLGFDPEDGIRKVKLTALVLARPDGGLKERFEVPFGTSASLHQVLADDYGAGNPLKRERLPLLARIDVAFRPAEGRTRGKRISLVLTHPDKSNLRGKTQREHLILDKYVAEWGLKAPSARAAAAE